MKKQALFVFAVALMLLNSCKKDKVTSTDPPVADPVPVTESGTLKLEFNNMVDNAALVFGTNYLNANGDTFKVSRFNYYISNVILVKNDNSEFAVPNSYFLVNHSKTGTNIRSISGIALGEYKSVKFMLGVDSTRNVSGAQTGDLDPAVAGGMFWTWNSGYVFFMLEGSSPQSGSSNKSFTYHIGGYGGINKTQRNFNLSLGTQTLNVTKTSSPSVSFNVNVNEFFKTPNLIKVSTSFNQVSSGAAAKVFADNYADMITLKEVKN